MRVLANITLLLFNGIFGVAGVLDNIHHGRGELHSKPGLCYRMNLGPSDSLHRHSLAGC